MRHGQLRRDRRHIILKVSALYKKHVTVISFRYSEPRDNVRLGRSNRCRHRRLGKHPLCLNRIRIHRNHGIEPRCHEPYCEDPTTPFHASIPCLYGTTTTSPDLRTKFPILPVPATNSS